MGITKIWAIKDSLSRVVGYAENAEKSGFSDMQQVLHYAQNGEKVTSGPEKTMYVTTLHCRRDHAYEDMQYVKRYFNKTGGNLAYHCVQSFKTGEVSPELCHQLGVELARRMWGDRFQVLIATHFNTGTYHNHLVINSVSYKNGQKFNCDKRAFYRMREISDALCREHNLTVIEHHKGKTPRSIYFAEKMGADTRFQLMRKAIDYAICMSNDMERFGKILLELGFVLRYDEKLQYPTIRSIDSKKAVRLWRLGEEYEIERIRQRIHERPLGVKYQSQFWYKEDRQKWRIKYPVPRQYQSIMQLILTQSNLYRLYLHYCYLLGAIPKRRTPLKPFSPALRLELQRLDAIIAQTRLLGREGLETAEQVAQFLARTQEQIEAVEQQRSGIYNKLQRCSVPEEQKALKAQRDGCTQQLSQLRKDKKNAQIILEQTPERCRYVECELALRQGFEPMEKIKRRHIQR